MSLDGIEKLKDMTNEEILADIYRSQLSTLTIIALGVFALTVLVVTLFFELSSKGL